MFCGYRNYKVVVVEEEIWSRNGNKGIFWNDENVLIVNMDYEIVKFLLNIYNVFLLYINYIKIYKICEFW